jgi:hypothetical protein
MIMTSAVEARIHAVAPESIAIHFTCDEQDFGFAPNPGIVDSHLVQLILKGFRHVIVRGSIPIRIIPGSDSCHHT